MFDVSETSYDNFMGRYSERLGPVFADFAGVEAGQKVLDVGAGTGALTTELVRRGAEAAAADPSPSFVAALERKLPDADVRAATAEELPWPDDSFDVVLAQLVLTFMNDAPAGVAEMRRVVRPGGVVAVCMWDRHGMDMLAAIHRTQRAVADSGTTEARTAYRSRDEIEGLFAGAGFTDVQTELLEVEREYAGFDELWDALADGAGPAGAWVKALDDETLAKAREELHRQVGEPSGAFTLHGRAWATRAMRA
ncbi:MAG: class SAM-dependent methyltransferase [Actinomycetia bacterium]|nr:class SAM-dependent methyltransferase [Actinomycetes bacterium]